MTTSLAASPVLPIATAAVAAALILGTLSSSPTTVNADLAAGDAGTPPAAAAADPGYGAGAPPVAGKVVKKCSASACTITFPTGGTTKALGTTLTATKLYVDGISITVGTKDLVANLTTAAKSGGYTVKVVKVEGVDAASRTVTVKITKK